jgi:hypothetical protein
MFEPVSAPPHQPAAGARAAVPALIEGAIPLPPVLSLRSKDALGRLYSRDHLSAREISRLVGASRSGVLRVLDRCSVPLDKGRPTRIGPVPFGFAYLNHQLVKNDAEQAAIRMMQKERASGLSLREIAGKLNSMLVPTKQGGVWQANPVRRILVRA